MKPELLEQLRREGYMDLREIHGRIYGLQMFLYTTGLLSGLDEYGYYGRWCYHTLEEAREALEAWDGLSDPPGNWIKYKGEPGERHNPNYKKP